MMVSCRCCGKKFYAYPKLIAKGNGKFCSKECYGKSHSLSMRKENHPGWKGGKILRVCECGREFYASRYRVNLGRARYCSVKCRTMYLPWDTKKERNANWKGGVAVKTRGIRFSAEYKMWRKEVFKRDNWTCVKCGARSTYLNAHHVKSFSKHPELRLDVSNGITLCCQCHKNEHKRKK